VRSVRRCGRRSPRPTTPARSLGEGCEQEQGSEYAATDLECISGADEDRFAVELVDCYPDATGLSSLGRTIALDRTAETVTVVDGDRTRTLVEFEPVPGEVDATEGTVELQTTISPQPLD